MFNFLKPDSSSHFVTYFKDTSRDPSSSLSLLLLFSSSQTRPSFITPPALNFCCCSSQLFTNIKATFMLTTGSVCHVLFKHSYSLIHTHTRTHFTAGMILFTEALWKLFQSLCFIEILCNVCRNMLLLVHVIKTDDEQIMSY